MRTLTTLCGCLMLGSAFAADELVPAALTETASVPMHRYLASEPSAPRNMPMPRQPSMPASSGCSACSSSQDSALPGTTETNSAISGRRRQPECTRQHGIAHRGRHGVGARSQQLGEKERIATGEGAQPCRRTAGIAGQFRDRGFRQRHKTQPP